MEDLWRPVIRDEYSVVRQPPIEANSFELKPALITMVQKNQFTGHPSEDPNELGRFLRMANIVKLDGVNPDVINLQLFPFSLRDIAASGLNPCLMAQSINGMSLWRPTSAYFSLML